MTSCIGKMSKKPHSKVEGLLIKKIDGIAKEMYPDIEPDFYIDSKTGDITSDNLTAEQIGHIGKRLGQ
ncbi:hypothetical protein GVN16_12285 [Emticicia sp. CRIBPO]|jgi:hypothetical protein|uniref:hypothetical protein n=1 Tax=Emticicia sp. CRIBPO TaxID=2683258 RepID=UPI001411D75C|nr:hypothetical protein [Emticicia sp. CRIBPO]NBA86547.1 hypothetical protein [Emticicia sp. CRIBPO]